MTPLRSKSALEPQKIFVLDTSVIIFDHHSILNFDEHDVAIPITVLEELDHFKKGRDTLNYAAREFIRFLDEIAESNSLTEWIDIPGENKGAFKIIMNDHSTTLDANMVFAEEKMDHRILNAAVTIQEQEPTRKVILVSKDINLRLKAKALNICAEDYETGKVKEVEKLMTGVQKVIDVTHDQISELYS
ncbi:MAG: ribonuclease, partial [Flavobacteriales bacterium]|nr:ribonuclease [Flavobacteriales bacterium]